MSKTIVLFFKGIVLRFALLYKTFPINHEQLLKGHFTSLMGFYETSSHHECKEPVIQLK